jgi:hypothetical protein
MEFSQLFEASSWIDSILKRSNYKVIVSDPIYDQSTHSYYIKVVKDTTDRSLVSKIYYDVNKYKYYSFKNNIETSKNLVYLDNIDPIIDFIKASYDNPIRVQSKTAEVNLNAKFLSLVKQIDLVRESYKNNLHQNNFDLTYDRLHKLSELIDNFNEIKLNDIPQSELNAGNVVRVFVVNHLANMLGEDISNNSYDFDSEYGILESLLSFVRDTIKPHLISLTGVDYDDLGGTLIINELYGILNTGDIRKVRITMAQQILDYSTLYEVLKELE